MPDDSHRKNWMIASENVNQAKKVEEYKNNKEKEFEEGTLKFEVKFFLILIVLLKERTILVILMIYLLIKVENI